MGQYLPEQMMQRALGLARQGQGRVEPNPMVGAVIVQGDQVVGEGWHENYGGPHAEINALKQAGKDAQGATMYVTLEPCCHHGKTPPCTDAVIQAGIKRVVVAGRDPYSQVAGQGITALEQAGIAVSVGLLQDHAERLNRPYFKLVRTGLPYVIAKWAMTLDGRIATATGDSKWISCLESRQRVHELRGRVDAIIVGVGTAFADDPLLTARPSGSRSATRIVLDSKLRLPVGAQLVRTARLTPTLLVHSSADADRIKVLQELGCECLYLESADRPGMAKQLLKELGRRRMTNVMVEGGSQVLGSFFDGRLVNEVWAFIAPKWVGSAQASGPVAGAGIRHMAQAGQLAEMKIEQVGVDAFIRGQCTYQDQPAT